MNECMYVGMYTMYVRYSYPSFDFIRCQQPFAQPLGQVAARARINALKEGENIFDMQVTIA